MTEDTPSLETADEAYAKAKAGFAVGDIELRPFSVKRRFAADRIGLKWGVIPSDDPLRKHGRYAGALRDATVVLWLCTIPCRSEITEAVEWTVERADRMPEEAYSAAQEWAESIGMVDVDTDAFREGLKTFLQIKLGEEVSRFRPVQDTPGKMGTESGNSNGQPSELVS